MLVIAFEVFRIKVTCEILLSFLLIWWHLLLLTPIFDKLEIFRIFRIQ